MNELENYIIETFKVVFEKYPTLTKLPVYSWGRFYKYECSGNAFETCITDWGGEGLWSMGRRLQNRSEFELHKTISKDVELFSIESIRYFCLDRDEIVELYDFDDRGGQCLVVVKDGDDFKVVCQESDSPE